MPKKNGKKTSRGIKQDRKRRSKEPWERGRGAKRKSNPNYTPCTVTIKKGKNKGKRVKRYCLRKPKKK